MNKESKYKYNGEKDMVEDNATFKNARDKQSE